MMLCAYIPLQLLNKFDVKVCLLDGSTFRRLPIVCKGVINYIDHSDLCVLYNTILIPSEMLNSLPKWIVYYYYFKETKNIYDSYCFEEDELVAKRRLRILPHYQPDLDAMDQVVLDGLITISMNFSRPLYIDIKSLKEKIINIQMPSHLLDNLLNEKNLHNNSYIIHKINDIYNSICKKDAISRVAFEKVIKS